MRRSVVATMAMVAVWAVPDTAAATVDLTAHRIRVGDHPAFVRVVVDFTDGRLGSNDSEAVDPDPFGDGRAIVDVRHHRIQAQAAAVRRFGLRVRLTQARNRIRIRVTGARRRFKHMSRTQLTGPDRVVLDVYKSRPAAGGEIPRAARGCLAFRTWSSGRGAVRAAGTARDLFESSFVLIVRDARGRVRGTRVVTYPTSGRWTQRVRHRATSVQSGTLEAVAHSARDGALVCIAQVRVTLRPRSPAPVGDEERGSGGQERRARQGTSAVVRTGAPTSTPPDSAVRPTNVVTTRQWPEAGQRRGVVK
jgi:hypothetical protein